MPMTLTWTAKDTFGFRSYQAGWSFGRTYYRANPYLNIEQLEHVVSTLQPGYRFSSSQYKLGFKLAYLAKFDKDGNQLPDGRNEKMATTKTEQKNGTVESKLDAARKAIKKNADAPVDNYEKASYVNNVTFSGRLGKDMEYVETSTGKELIKSSLAVWMPGKTKGESLTLWLEVTMWLNTDNEDEFNQALGLEKGMSVVVEGRFSMREYNGKNYYGVTATRIEDWSTKTEDTV